MIVAGMSIDPARNHVSNFPLPANSSVRLVAARKLAAGFDAGGFQQTRSGVGGAARRDAGHRRQAADTQRPLRQFDEDALALQEN